MHEMDDGRMDGPHDVVGKTGYKPRKSIWCIVSWDLSIEKHESTRFAFLIHVLIAAHSSVHVFINVRIVFHHLLHL